MSGKGRLIGWVVVITFWGILLTVGESYARKTAAHNREIQETINTAEDMIEWIGYDVENDKVDSTIADTYIDNLEGIIIDLGVTR